MTNKLPIDIGSGITKWINKEGEVCRINTVAGQLTEEDAGTFSLENMPQIQFDDKVWLVGTHAESVFSPARRTNSLTQDWAGSDGWMALLYYAIGKSYPKGGKLTLTVATGLPQALYSSSRDRLLTQLNRTHIFSIKETEYEVTIEAMMVPQALAALIYQSTLDSDILKGTAATIDVGTYTTGWTVLRHGQMQNWRSSGAEIGVSDLGKALRSHIKDEYGIKLDPAEIPDILINRELPYRDQKIDISDVLAQLTIQVAKPVEDQIRMAWEGGAGDIPRVYVNGGGGEFFLPAFQRIIPHAKIGHNPAEAVVRGLGEFLN